MPTRTRRAVRLPVVGAAVLVLVTACGESDSGASGARAGGATGAAGSSAAASDDFCTRAAQLDQRVDDAVSDLGGDDPSVKDVFAQLGQELRSMDPPDAIASDWDALAGGIDELATAFEDFDLTDPDTLAALEAAEEKLTTAGDNVESYLRDECGIEP